MKKLATTSIYHLHNTLKRIRDSVLNPHNRKQTILIGLMFLLFVYMLLYAAYQHFITEYKQLESVIIEDRMGAVLTLSPNNQDAYVRYTNTLPPRVAELLVKKEDRFFYVHPGFNPFSVARALWNFLRGRRIGGASTITEQLVKNVLQKGQDRSLVNKVTELLYAVDLELFTSKKELLVMYANTVYMGNQTQGLEGASALYFNKKLADLDDTKISMLLGTLSSPSTQNPWKEANATASRNDARRIGVTFDPSLAIVTQEHIFMPPRQFELASMHIDCLQKCRTTIDADLSSHLRQILQKHVALGYDAGARSGAIVVLKIPGNEVLAVVGTPDTDSQESGQQINMAIQPRPIGSTAKPFIYLQGFTKGLRPYTLVDDREYKFPIGSGFPLYPKNYDGQYRGWITLHAALSNSLNVPTVQVLKYVGLSEFYGFLERDLGFKPLQDLDSYQYGIALGALEMDPLTLAHYLSVFPEKGRLQPLKLFLTGTNTSFISAPMSQDVGEKKVADPALAALVSRVLNDRLTGVQQFGLASSLNLSQSNYAVKTGTSQDYHDSWTIGYTPDFLVVVWFGNPDNTPLKHITGQSGAGSIWHDAMELLINSSYNKKTPLDFSGVQDIQLEGSIDFGLQGDVVSEHRSLLPDDTLILSPQDGDTYLKEEHTSIPLVSSEEVSWYANGLFVGRGEKVFFSPKEIGDYTIEARSEHATRTHSIVHVIAR